MSYDVLISGGGPVGLGLAIELGQRGISVALVEPHHTPPRIPKGQNLTQRTMEHMQAWGVEKAIRAAKTIPKEHGIGGLTAYGTLLSGYHYDWFKRQTVDQYYSAANERLPQYETENVLRARVAELDNVACHFGWKTTDIEQDADGASLIASDGRDEMTLRGRFLVGCDGSRSLVRRAAGITQTREDHDRLMALIVFSSPAFYDLVAPFRNKQFYNVLHPDHDGYWMFFGMVEWGKSFFFHAPVPPDIDRGSFDFKAYLHRAVGQKFDLDLDYIGFWDLRITTADTYRKGRVFIAGDAAHSHPPYGGYGINTGFEDARNLGWKLAALLQGWGGPPLLDSYEAERRPVFLSTARDFIGKFIEDDRAFVRAYDPSKDKAAFGAAWSKRASGGDLQGIDTFAPHYEGSPVIHGTSGRGTSAIGIHSLALKPGHHMPPIALSDDSTAANALGPRLTILCRESDLLSKLDYLSGETTLLAAPDMDCPATFAVIRPDGFVAGLVDDIEELPAVLASACGQDSSV